MVSTLAAVGLYGVLAFTVTRRTREIGIRLAKGASPADIRNMILREVGVMILFGVVIGVPSASLLSRFVESLLFEMKGSDPVVLAASVILVAGVSLASGYLPARRAINIQPLNALRYEYGRGASPNSAPQSLTKPGRHRLSRLCLSTPRRAMNIQPLNALR